MPLATTQRERLALAVIALLFALGLLGLAILSRESVASVRNFRLAPAQFAASLRSSHAY